MELTKKQKKIKRWLQYFHYGDFIFEARGDKHYYFEDKKHPNFFFLGKVPRHNLVLSVNSRYGEVFQFCVARYQVPVCGTCKHCFTVNWQVCCAKKNYIYSKLQIACDEYEADK